MCRQSELVANSCHACLISLAVDGDLVRYFWMAAGEYTVQLLAVEEVSDQPLLPRPGSVQEVDRGSSGRNTVRNAAVLMEACA